MVPLFWIVARFIPVLPLVLLCAPVNVILARYDADRCQRRLGDRPVKAWLAAPSPVVYLFIRYARDWDLRSGRPLWTSIALLPPVLFLEAMANIGAYAMFVHGW